MASISTMAEELLTCSICFEVYTDPKTLPCLHSFCKSCIDKFTKEIHNKKEYSCPVCRETFKLSNNNVDTLKTNFCLKNLIELLNSNINKEMKKMCSFCGLKGEKIEASSKCLTCKDLLCSECAEHRHRSTTLTLNHKIVSLTELSSGKYNEEIRSKQQIPCSEHTGEDLRYFCETCDVPICRDCIVLGHQNHKYVAPSDARKSMEEKMNTHMCSLKENLERFQAGKENVATAVSSLEVKKQKLKADLEKQMNTIIKNTMDSKKSVENDFDQIVKSKEDTLRKQNESIEKERKLLEETYLFCNNLLKRGSDIEILSMKSEIKDRLSTLQSLKRTECCNVEDIVLPIIETRTDGHTFRLVYQKKEKCKKHSNQEAKKKERTKQDEAKAEKETIPEENKDSTNGFYPKLLQRFSERQYGDLKKPKYTCITWMNGHFLVVADLRNQKVKILSTQNDDSSSIPVKDCMVVTSFKGGLACKTEGDKLHIINNSFDITQTFSGVSTLLTCHPNSTQISWISGLDRICVLESSKMKDVIIIDPNKTGKLSSPKFGHVLLNGMFVVSDWSQACVFILRGSGYIERRKYCSPGSISSDYNNIIYVCDHRKSHIEIFRWSGETLWTVKIGSIIQNPRSIALNTDNKILITNGTSIVLVQLE